METGGATILLSGQGWLEGAIRSVHFGHSILTVHIYNDWCSVSLKNMQERVEAL
jgi:hypothetical protein